MKRGGAALGGGEEHIGRRGGVCCEEGRST